MIVVYSNNFVLVEKVTDWMKERAIKRIYFCRTQSLVFSYFVFFLFLAGFSRAGESQNQSECFCFRIFFLFQDVTLPLHSVLNTKTMMTRKKWSFSLGQKDDWDWGWSISYFQFWFYFRFECKLYTAPQSKTWQLAQIWRVWIIAKSSQRLGSAGLQQSKSKIAFFFSVNVFIVILQHT